MTQEELAAVIASILSRAPQWIRHDLLQADSSLRARAEETLAAMIAAGIAPDSIDLLRNGAE